MVIIIIGLQEQKLCNGKSILETIFLIKNVGKKRPTAEDIFNHIFYTTASNIDFSFINETIKYPIPENKIDGNFKTAENTQAGNPS